MKTNINLCILCIIYLHLYLLCKFHTDRYKPVSNVQPVQNESNNPLANLLCQYNSDSDTEDSKKDTQKLDDQVNDFFKVNI